ncbi:unnamed protein product [Allacma fusca]|uniref:DUF4806 domain-containing protein n=1 Tax=Allacma fusca TaxID=39272 RepID=A0A8J2JY91_9HEXA|nr:unnamed protein product [Allacma fusca]
MTAHSQMRSFDKARHFRRQNSLYTQLNSQPCSVIAERNLHAPTSQKSIERCRFAWSQYSIKKTVGGVYETELEARQKQNRAVDTSDVNTDIDKKRKRKPVKAFSTLAPVKMSKHFKHVTTPVYSEDSSDDSNLPLPLPTLGNSSPNKISVTTNVAGKSGVNVRHDSSQDVQPIGVSPLQVLNLVSDSDIESQESSGRDLTDLVSHTPNATARERTPNMSSGPKLFGHNSNTNMGIADFQREVLHSLSVIKTRIKHVEETQEILLHRSVPETVKRSWKLKLPAESVSDALRLDSLLIEDENERELEIRISKLGGTDVGKCTRNILRKILTDEAAQGLNWRGQNGKVAMIQMRLTTIISDAVIGFLGTNKATTNLVEDSIKEWLKQASNRISQKLKRQKLHPSDD